MYTRWARSWAARGVPSLRLDGWGVGDSDGPDAPEGGLRVLYDEEAIVDGVRAVESLRAAHGAAELALVGLCSGAFVAFHVAARVDGVRDLVLINPQVLAWDDDEAEAARVLLMRRAAFSWRRWRSLLARRDALSGIATRTVAVVRRARPGGRSTRPAGDADWLVRALAALRERGITAHFVMSSGDAGIDYLRRHLGTDYERAPAGSMTMRVIDGADHTFRPVWTQDVLADVLAGLVGRSG
jgi:pimeloyl-ACP methyl ester carboxylesterase